MVHRSTERTVYDENYDFADFYFEKDKDFEELNILSRSGKITPSERTRRREKMLTDKILKKFYDEEEQIQDGRK